MAAVGGYQVHGGFSHQAGYYNTDPGVYEPECDFYGEDPAGPTGYPDTEEFLSGMQENVNQEARVLDQDAEVPAAPATAQPPPEAPLPLAGDYQGMGGPKSVPLYTPTAFERPPVSRTILDEIFLEPSDNQLDAYYRVIHKGKVVQNKNRLKWAIFCHYSLLFFILCKLTPDILDRCDVFVLEVEELFVPKPLIWEWLWLLSIPVTIFGLSACKNSNLKNIQQFLVGTLICSLLPVFLGMGLHFMDVYEFLAEGVSNNILVWQGYPYSVLWYAFFFVALQVHLYEIYFANCLMKAWLPLNKKKVQ